jgi:hypothetical protein
MAGLTGVSTKGVGHDIVDYLREVAEYFGINIRVTSGYRDPDAQARAMFDNWSKMKHGRIYKKTALPEVDRAELDDYWTTANNAKATAQDKTKAEADFLELAKARVGSKSMHSRGRAVDVARAHIDQRAYRAITMHLHEVKEGNRTDIYHFESLPAVPTVDDAMRTSWQDLDNASRHPHKPPQPAHGIWC